DDFDLSSIDSTKDESDDFDLSSIDSTKDEKIEASDFDLSKSDEDNNLNELEEEFIDLESLKAEFPEDMTLVLSIPIFGKLSDLSKDELDLFQLVHNFSVVSDIVSNSEISEPKTYQILQKLSDEGFINPE
ncbi:hypothetical protein JXR93_07895, partial [bacterium]|nr:hypothetical protein [bacterium]